MGNTSSRTDSILHPPANYSAPAFPSLYDPRRDFYDNDKNPVQYLFYSKGLRRSKMCSLFLAFGLGPRLWSLTELVLLDIFRFTLYWTGIFYALTYGLCGIWAALIAGYASRRRKRRAITALLAFLPFLTLGSLSAVVGATVTGNAIRALSPCQCVSEALNRLRFGGGLLRRKFHNVNVSGRALIQRIK